MNKTTNGHTASVTLVLRLAFKRRARPGAMVALLLFGATSAQARSSVHATVRTVHANSSHPSSYDGLFAQLNITLGSFTEPGCEGTRWIFLEKAHNYYNDTLAF